MNLANLHFKREWVENQRILEYTLYTLSRDILDEWSGDLFQSIQDWTEDNQPLLLFDLSNPNVGMSYFVLSGRDLFRLHLVAEKEATFQQYFHAHPNLNVKLAIVLSRTMGNVLSSRALSSERQNGLIGKAFFSREDAMRWLLIEEDFRARDIITQGVSYNEMMKAIDPTIPSGEVYGALSELRMLVNGSLEIVAIAEDKPITIGRSRRSDLDVTSHGQPSLTVSRQHIQITLRDNNFYVTDLESRNGTYIGNQKIPPNEPILLKRDDPIRIGGLSIVVLL